MRRSLSISVVATSFLVFSVFDFTFTAAFLFPSSSHRASLDTIRQHMRETSDSVKHFKQGGRAIFNFNNIPGKNVKKVQGSGSRSARLRRAVGIAASAVCFWFGSAAVRTKPSYASTAEATISSRPAQTMTTSLDKMVDGYVKDHMFDDDAYEPVESVYREAMTDKVRGAYPKKLSEIATSVLGQDGVKTDKQKSTTGIGGLILNGINFLQRRAGLSESTAIIVLTGSFVILGPTLFLVVGMMVGAQSKRQINSVMKKRYGDTYTVDATIKVEEDVELPDDDEDDDDDDDDNDDDDDDDDAKDD